jgi:protein gp37
MGDTSTIEWTDATWNPWRGCTKVSPGCAHCYMFREQRRYGRDPTIVTRCSPATFNAPLRWREGRMVFTCSWSDWFHEDADEWRDEAWAIVQATPWHTYQILTKRPERILEHLPASWDENGWSNVWLGVSIENRRYINRADVLREVPAAVRFISAEPLLGPLLYDCDCGEVYFPHWRGDDMHEDLPQLNLDGIDWLIAGGESGPHSRPMRPDWATALRDQCNAQRVAFFFKQWGGARAGGAAPLDGREWHEYPTSNPQVKR